jgi:peptidoglycan hydrolase-like protein with peptidoglycan-binding domain
MKKNRAVRLALVLAALTTLVIPAVGVAEPAQAATCKSQVFQYGSRGTCVEYIQAILNSKGLGTGTDGGKTSMDGIFGWRTHDLVTRVQQKWALTQDGIVGPNTWKALCDTNGGRKTSWQTMAGC